MADDGDSMKDNAGDNAADVVVLTGSVPSNGVSWGSTPTATFFVVAALDDQDVQPSLRIEDGICVDDAADHGGSPMKTENTGEDEKPAEGEDPGH
jgi:hypothetical protein